MATAGIRVSTLVKGAVLVGVLTLWVLVPHPLEGPVVWAFSDEHGVHRGDLVGVALGALVGWRWLR